MRMKRFDRFWFSGLRFLLLNDFEAWLPHPCALRKGALFGFQHLGPEPTLSQRRERMGHPPAEVLLNLLRWRVGQLWNDLELQVPHSCDLCKGAVHAPDPCSLKV